MRSSYFFNLFFVVNWNPLWLHVKLFMLVNIWVICICIINVDCYVFRLALFWVSKYGRLLVCEWDFSYVRLVYKFFDKSCKWSYGHHCSLYIWCESMYDDFSLKYSILNFWSQRSSFVGSTDVKVAYAECVDNFSVDFIVNERYPILKVIGVVKLMMNSLSRLVCLHHEIVGYSFKIKVLSNSLRFFLQVDGIEHNLSILMYSLQMNVSLEFVGEMEMRIHKDVFTYRFTVKWKDGSGS